MQTYDTLYVGNPEFVKAEKQAITDANFKSKELLVLTPDNPLEYNGCTIKMIGNMDAQGYLSMTQKGQGAKLQVIDKTDPERHQRYVEQRARGAYIASICQPEACFDLSTAARIQDPQDKDFDVLNSRIQWQIDNQDRGLNMVPLDLATAKLMVFTDGSFANNEDMSSQIGFLMTLVNETRERDQFRVTGSIVHYTSVKCKRVTRSVLASEVYGMMTGFDIAIAASDTIRKVTKQLGLPNIPVVICTDSRSLYECLIRLGSTDEKRLMIDVMALRESYVRREVQEFRWINGKDNPADAMTKATPNGRLEEFVTNNQLTVRVEGYVERPELAKTPGQATNQD